MASACVGCSPNDYDVVVECYKNDDASLKFLAKHGIITLGLVG